MKSGKQIDADFREAVSILEHEFTGLSVMISGYKDKDPTLYAQYLQFGWAFSSWCNEIKQVIEYLAPEEVK